MRLDKPAKSFTIQPNPLQKGHENTPMRAKDSYFTHPLGAFQTPMLVEMYKKELHEEHMRLCLTKHGMSEELLQDLPEYGFIVLEDKSPIALGFLRKVEGPYAILDSYITNPEFSSKERNLALEHIMESIISGARQLGVNKLLGFSMHKDLVDRSLRMGFTKMPYDVVMMDVNTVGSK